MKKLVSCVLCLVIVLSMAVPVAATLDYTYIDSIYSTIQYNEFWGVIQCTATVESMDDYLLEIEMTLQEYNESTGVWDSLKTWSATGYHYVFVEKSYAVARGKDHRICVGAFVYDSNGNIIDSGVQINYE